jgi:hypothetical protein
LTIFVKESTVLGQVFNQFKMVSGKKECLVKTEIKKPSDKKLETQGVFFPALTRSDKAGK